MKFITTFTFRPDPEARAEGIARFQKTGGSLRKASSSWAAGDRLSQ